MKNYWICIATMSVLLIATVAGANNLSSPILGFTSTSGGVSYLTSEGYISGSGTGTLTTAAGTLPVGMAVNYNIVGFMYPQPATVSGNFVSQPFISEVQLYVTLASDGSNVLFGDTDLVDLGYEIGRASCRERV